MDVDVNSKRALIMFGSAQVFMEQGTRTPSVQDLITRAGVSRRTFYAYFEDKQAVMHAIYLLGVERLLGECEDAYRLARSAEDLIDGAIEAHLRSAWLYPRLMYVLGGEAQHQDSSLYETRIDAMRQIASWYREAVDAPPESLIVDTTLLALELAVRLELREGDEGRRITRPAIERMRGAMRHIAHQVLLSPG
ncbi:MAG: hypothetical protein SangKO_091300 [Sandaracinaceae bacterium]